MKTLREKTSINSKLAHQNLTEYNLCISGDFVAADFVVQPQLHPKHSRFTLPRFSHI